MSAKVPSKGDVFPDMHHKMSKKIAQLTKVIYHLNTINENNATEVEALKSVHDNEIQQIIHDASAKIKKMSEAVEKHQAIVRNLLFNNLPSICINYRIVILSCRPILKLNLRL